MSVRKRGTAEDEKFIVIQGDDDNHNEAVKSSSSSSEDNDKPGLISDRCLNIFGTLVFLFFVYTVAVPKSDQRLHKKVLDQQLESMAMAIEQNHKSLGKKYESFSAQMNERLKMLTKIEEEDQGTESDKSTNQEEKDTQNSKDDTNDVANLLQEIAKLREEMTNIKEEMAFDKGTFCEDCTGNFADGGKMKCSEYRDALMGHHKHTKEIASEAVEKLDPDNCKLKHSDPKDHGTFCAGCTGQFVGGALVTKCGKRRDYFMSKYGKSKEVATEIVMATDPVNCITNT
mmetsp:Transcript_17304/g.24041  ORF Transcript_17304/g.24041 Transcript_17304/m.24041 type:complete len:286 (+) Transcript_17304:93-950(+)